MKQLFRRLVSGTEGQDLIEYALLAAMIAIALVVAMGVAKTAIESEFSTVAASVTAS